MKYYFLKTLKVNGREKMRPLPHQTFPDGSAVSCTLNCANASGDKVRRSSYPLGTVFAADSLAEAKGYYTTAGGHIFPLNIPEGEYKEMSHRPTEEMRNAYRAYRESVPKESMSDLFREAEREKETEAERYRESFLSSIQKDPRYSCPTIEEDGFYVSRDDWFFILSNIINGQPLLLTGPTGSGKTEILSLACRKIGIAFRKYDMGGVHDPMEQLLGTHRLESGSSVFDYSAFAKDVQTPGVILLDELSRAPRETNNILFPLLDSSRVLRVDMAAGKDMRAIPVHPGCVFVATANVGDEYTGTTEIDEALRNRFMPMELDYLPEDIEIQVLARRESISEASARKIVTVAHTVRRKKESRDLIGDHSISTRETLQAARLVSWGYTPLQAMTRAFLPLFEGTDKEGDRAIVKAIFATT